MHAKHILSAILGPGPSGPESAGSPDELEVIAGELIDAVHAKDAKATVEALRAAFQCMESEPHEESEHEPME